MKLNFKKINFTLPYLYIVSGVVVGAVGANTYIKNLKVNEELVFPYPSIYSEGYKSLVGDSITTEESTFVVNAIEPINISTQSKFVKELQEFSNKYVNTLLRDDPEYNLSDFYHKKSEDTYDLILEDFELNEPLSMMSKSNLKIIKNDQGCLSADGNNAIILIEFEFTVDKIINNSNVTSMFEEGKTYRQTRELILKKDKKGVFKIYESLIGVPIEL